MSPIGVSLKAGSAGPSGSFSPLDISNLDVWLDGSDLSTLTGSPDISQWDDKSGNSNHASQGTAALQPLRVGDGQNGLNTVQSDGSEYMTTSYTPGTAMTYIWVGKDSAGAKIFAGSQDATNRSFIASNQTTQEVAGGVGTQWWSTIKGTTAVTSFGIYVLRYNGTTVTLRANGTQEYNAAQSGAGNNAQGIYVFGNNNNGSVSNIITGDIGELHVVSRSMSNSEIASDESYLSNKWGLALS